MDNPAHLPVHRFDLSYLAAEQAGNPLMTEANTQNRHTRIQDGVARDAEIPFAIRPSWSGRDDYAAEVELANLNPIHLVVANDDRHFAGNRRNGMDQVESERIVVIDD